MNCTRIRYAISARLDGEDPGLSPGDVDAHVESCVGCRQFAASAARLHRSARLAPAPDVPDLTPAILARIAPAADRGEPENSLALRWILVALALVQIGVALPALVLGSDAGAAVHTARHIGSFDMAIAVGFLFAAWRPSRIPGLLPVVAALVACLVASSLLDVLAGNTQALGEAQHATDFAGLAVLWLLTRTAHAPVGNPRAELA
jgi:predicted anti-sigma-YlaC factor YlaD